MLRSRVNSLGNPCDQSRRRKEGYGGKDLQKSKVLSLASRSEGRWNTNNNVSAPQLISARIKCPKLHGAWNVSP